MKNFPEVVTVKNISDKRYMPRKGKIRLGVKVKNQNGKEYPKETDYFVCPPEVTDVFGDKPKKLEIMLPLNDISKIFPQAYKWYGGAKGVKCKGNGERAWRKMDNGEIKEIPCPCEKLDNKQCSLRGNLMFIINRVNMGFIYQLDTGSYHSTVSINSGIKHVGDYIQSITGENRFALIPLLLERTPQKTGGGSANSAPQTHYIVRLYPNINEDQYQKLRDGNLGLHHAKNIILPEPEDINPEMDDSQPAIPVIDMGIEGIIDAEEPEVNSVVDKKEPAQKKEPRKFTQKIKLNGKEVMTAGIKSLQIKTLNAIQARDVEHKNHLKEYITQCGIEKISELTFDEAMAFIEDPFNKEPESEQFDNEQSKFNSQFWAIVGEIGLDKDERDLLKRYFYKLYQVESMHKFTEDMWLGSVDFLNDSKREPEVLKSMLSTIKDSLWGVVL